MNREKLNAYMAQICHEDICVAFSGGVDSSVILKAACEVAKENGTTVHAVTFDTRLHPQADLQEAKKVAAEVGAVHHILKVNELENPAILNNPVDRCYLCKYYLFEQLKNKALKMGITCVLEGTNADDLLVYRPGTKAVRELGIISPLAELGITKDQVRQIAEMMNISTAKRPSSPCLATRLPYGTKIDFELLKKIDAGEQWMQKKGFPIVRLRVHGDIVRIEIPPENMEQFIKLRTEIVHYMKTRGFIYITLDLEGFRSGSMDIHLNL